MEILKNRSIFNIWSTEEEKINNEWNSSGEMAIVAEEKGNNIEVKKIGKHGNNDGNKKKGKARIYRE